MATGSRASTLQQASVLSTCWRCLDHTSVTGGVVDAAVTGSFFFFFFFFFSLAWFCAAHQALLLRCPPREERQNHGGLVPRPIAPSWCCEHETTFTCDTCLEARQATVPKNKRVVSMKRPSSKVTRHSVVPRTVEKALENKAGAEQNHRLCEYQERAKKKRRDILHRRLKITLFFAKQNLAFRAGKVRNH